MPPFDLYALEKAGKECNKLLSNCLRGKVSHIMEQYHPFTVAPVYNRHKHGKKDEKEVKTSTTTANNHLLIGITNKLLLFNILIAGDSSLKT